MSKLLVSSALAFALFAVPACAPEPRNVPCQNGGDCEKVDADFRYCLESRCVECVGNVSCGDGNLCIAGVCERTCKDGRDCPKRQVCSADKCVDK